MEKKSYPILQMKKSLQKLEGEAAKLMELSEGIPGIEKNITPIMAFIDILKFHLDFSNGLHLCDKEGDKGQNTT